MPVGRHPQSRDPDPNLHKRHRLIRTRNAGSGPWWNSGCIRRPLTRQLQGSPTSSSNQACGRRTGSLVPTPRLP